MIGPLLLLTVVTVLLQAETIRAAAQGVNAVHDNDNNNADLLASTLQRLQRLEQVFGEEKQQWQQQIAQWEEERQQWRQEKLQREGQRQERHRFKQEMLKDCQSLNDRINGLKDTSPLTKRAPENEEQSRQTRKPKDHDWEKPMKALKHQVAKMEKQVRDLELDATTGAEFLNSKLDAQQVDIKAIRSNDSGIVQDIFVTYALSLIHI